MPGAIKHRASQTKQNAMTKLKPKHDKNDVPEIYFSDIKNELIPIELQFITNCWNREFHWHNEHQTLLDFQTLDVILKLLKFQSGQFDSGAGEIINSVLIARIKSFILNKPNK
jgi:hypothetical protein